MFHGHACEPAASTPHEVVAIADAREARGRARGHRAHPVRIPPAAARPPPVPRRLLRGQGQRKMSVSGLVHRPAWARHFLKTQNVLFREYVTILDEFDHGLDKRSPTA